MAIQSRFKSEASYQLIACDSVICRLKARFNFSNASGSKRGAVVASESD